jgi:hypothetical protein
MWGTVTIDGIVLRETITAPDGDSLTLSGQESFPPSPSEYVRATRGNIVGLLGRDAVVSVSDKIELSGLYRVAGADATLTDHANGSIVIADWSLKLARLGTERDVEFESRVPTISRQTDLAGPPAASYWHAAPPGVLDYFTGSAVPSASVTRQSAEGPVLVQRGIPADVAPRWTVAVTDAINASCRVVIDGYRRAGLDTASPDESWLISNAIVQVRSSDATLGAFEISSINAAGALRSTKAIVPTVNGVALTTVPQFTILRNDLEEVTVRLAYPNTAGRLTIDLDIRRGSRFVTGVIKRHSAATLGIKLVTNETGTAQTGGIRATAADADGNRYVLGSAKVPTITTTGAISKASVTLFDFFAGHEVRIGGVLADGDAYGDLQAQYLGTTGDRTRVIRR